VPAESSPVVTLVRTATCYYCLEAEETLDALARARVVNLSIVEARSDEGRALVAQHGPRLAPLVLLDGEFFSSGRLPKRKLARTLGARRHTLARP
jgi:hypothetical protein